jgi:chlorophyllide a reductase subunit Y
MQFTSEPSADESADTTDSASSVPVSAPATASATAQPMYAVRRDQIAAEIPEVPAPDIQEPDIQEPELNDSDAGVPDDTGKGCHGGRDRMVAAARQAGNSSVLDRYAKDYPSGPHDQPQSMCPAFGSLRVGLRMKRTATVLSGSACCVYGLTFTSHFYGARRSVGYVPFNSETLVTGKLFEDIREAVHELADPERFDTVIVTNLCVPTASGVPLRLLPDQINGVRIIGIDVPGFGVPTHAEAKDVLAGAMLAYARNEVQSGPVLAPENMTGNAAANLKNGDGKGAGSSKPVSSTGPSRAPSITLLGEMFPADPMIINQMIEPLGLRVGSTVPTREWRELYTALDCSAVAAIHPFYSASIREFELAGRPVFGSAPVGLDGTASWLDSLAAVCDVNAEKLGAVKDKNLAAIRAALANMPVKHRITLSGYEGSELIVARLLMESGAEIPYVGTACAKTPYSDVDREWLEARGVTVNFRASLEDDIYAMQTFKPDLAIGTTPVVQKAKEQAIPALYFTNLISARPLMGVAGAGSLAQVVNAAVSNVDRFAKMNQFFSGVGVDESAGVWQEVPQDRSKFKETMRRKRKKQEQSRNVEEAV